MESRRAGSYDRARWSDYNRGSWHDYDRGHRGDHHGSFVRQAPSPRSAVEAWPTSFRSLSIKREHNSYDATGDG
jgi:hypothetical protein